MSGNLNNTEIKEILHFTQQTDQLLCRAQSYKANNSKEINHFIQQCGDFKQQARFININDEKFQNNLSSSHFLKGKTRTQIFGYLQNKFLEFQATFYRQRSATPPTDEENLDEEILIGYLIRALESLSLSKNKENLLAILDELYKEAAQSDKTNSSINLLQRLTKHFNYNDELRFPTELTESPSPIVYFLNAELKELLLFHYNNKKNPTKQQLSEKNKVMLTTKNIQHKETSLILPTTDLSNKLETEIKYDRKKAIQSNSHFITLYLRALWLYLKETSKEEKKNSHHKRQTEITRLLKILIDKGYRPAAHLNAIRLGKIGYIGKDAYYELLFKNKNYPPSLLALADEFSDYLSKELTLDTPGSKKHSFFCYKGNDILWLLDKLHAAKFAEAKIKLDTLRTQLKSLKRDNDKTQKPLKTELLNLLDASFTTDTSTHGSEKLEIEKTDISKLDNNSFKRLSQNTPNRIHKPDHQIISEEANFYLSIFPSTSAFIGFNIGTIIGSFVLPGIGTIVGGTIGAIFSFLIFGNLGQLLIQKISGWLTLLLDKLAEKYDIYLPLEDKRMILNFAAGFSLIGALLGLLIPTIPIIGNPIWILSGSLLGIALGAPIGFGLLALGKFLGFKSTDMLKSTQRGIAAGVIFGFIGVGVLLLTLFLVSVNPISLVLIPVMIASGLIGAFAIGLLTLLYKHYRHTHNPLSEKNYFESAYGESTGASNTTTAIKWIFWALMITPIISPLLQQIPLLSNVAVHLRETLSYALQTTTTGIAGVAGYIWSAYVNYINKPKYASISQVEEAKQSNPQQKNIIDDLKNNIQFSNQTTKHPDIPLPAMSERSKISQTIEFFTGEKRTKVCATSLDTKETFYGSYRDSAHNGFFSPFKKQPSEKSDKLTLHENNFQ